MNGVEKAAVVQNLMRYRFAAMNIESLTEEKARIESVIYSLAPNLDGGSGGSSEADKMGADVARLVDVCRKISTEIAAYCEARKEVRRIVDRVWKQNEILGMDLHYRYIDFRTPYATAHDLGYSLGYERKVHLKALAVAYKFM